MTTTEGNDLEILEDRINDLEFQIISIERNLSSNRQTNQASNSNKDFVFMLVIPVTLFFLLLMGLNISYQTENKTITYDNNNLIELGLSAITLLSGVYSVKKYRESNQVNRNTEEA